MNITIKFQPTVIVKTLECTPDVNCWAKPAIGPLFVAMGNNNKTLRTSNLHAENGKLP